MKPYVSFSLSRPAVFELYYVLSGRACSAELRNLQQLILDDLLQDGDKEPPNVEFDFTISRKVRRVHKAKKATKKVA